MGENINIVQHSLPYAAVGFFDVLFIALAKLLRINHKRKSIHGINYSCGSISIKVKLNISARLLRLYTKGRDVNLDHCNCQNQ